MSDIRLCTTDARALGDYEHIGRGRRGSSVISKNATRLTAAAPHLKDPVSIDTLDDPQVSSCSTSIVMYDTHLILAGALSNQHSQGHCLGMCQERTVTVSNVCLR